MYHHTWLIFVFLLELGFHHVSQVGLKLLASDDLPSSASQSAGITGVSHCAWTGKLNFIKGLLCIYRDNHAVFVFSSVYVINHIY